MGPKEGVFPDYYRSFVAHVNNELFWESHEILEDVWRINGSLFYKALIIYASAFVHAQRGNPRGIIKQLTKAVNYLESYRPHYLGLDVDRLLSHAEACAKILDDFEAEPDHILVTRVPLPQLRLEPALVRGDESEWEEI